MVWIVLAVIAAIWVMCGALARAAYLAYFRTEYPGGLTDSLPDRGRFKATMFGLMGPGALAAVAISGGFRHGLKWW